jgi:hypothetical protein
LRLEVQDLDFLMKRIELKPTPFRLETMPRDKRPPLSDDISQQKDATDPSDREERA